MADLELRAVTKTFGGDRNVVDEGSIHVPDGSFAVLVGPSGCGKSTTLRMLAGLEELTAGSIYLGDRDISTTAPKDRDIAMVFQNYALYPHMTVRENMGLALKLAGTPKEEIARRVEEVLEAERAPRLRDPLADPLARHPPHAQAEAHVLGHGHVRVERVVLEHERDVAPLR